MVKTKGQLFGVFSVAVVTVVVAAVRVVVSDW